MAQELSLQLLVQDGLPPDWALGFRRLASLEVFNLPPGLRAAEGAPSARGFTSPVHVLSKGAAAQGLPPRWAAAGAFPRLDSLQLINLGAAGGPPRAWVVGGFPKLSLLNLASNGLTGTLPADLLARHPKLRTVSVGAVGA